MNSSAGSLILFILLFVYLSYLFWKKQQVDDEVATGEWNRRVPLFLLLGLAMVVGGSHFLVDSSVRLAKAMGLSEWAIGVTIVAAGTSAPEFATSLTAALRGRYGMSVGNLIGSDIFNMFGVLGMASILQHLSVDIGARSNMIVLCLMVVLVLVFMRTGWIVSRKEGIILLSISAARWVTSF